MTLAPPAAAPARAVPVKTSGQQWKWIAWLSGAAATLAAIAIPLLPVRMDQTMLTWPQGQSSANVTAPLVSYAPVSIDARVPCTAVRALGTGGVLVSTIPVTAVDRERYGLTIGVRAAPGQPAAAEVIQRGTRLLTVPVSALTGESCQLTVHSGISGTRAAVTGAGASDTSMVTPGDHRPQLTGLFTEARDPSAMWVSAEIDSRFTSVPGLLKQLALGLCIALTLLALYALHRLDRTDGRRSRRFLPARWRRITLPDIGVIATLLVWHVVGATTADDGYQFVMGRAAAESGYLANYFRYWGVPETPIGTPLYESFGLLASIWPAAVWVRLPSLLAGLAVWFILSREVAPRLGRAALRAGAVWTGALVFLAMWLPFNNGLRPEPIVALGTLLTWCSVERAIVTRRVLPLAIALLIAGLTFTAAPSAVITFAVFLAAAGPITRLLVIRARTAGWAALLLPVAAAGTFVLAVAFADQTFAAMLEMQRAHVISGPNLAWFDEYIRYQWLLTAMADGSAGRRCGVLAMGFAIVAGAVLLLRYRGRIPGLAVGPALRIIGTAVGAVILMSATPTKWTHQFGVFAGLAGAVAVMAGAALSAQVPAARRYQLGIAGTLLLLLALTFSGPNGWWYVSAYGIPWFDIPPSIKGIGANRVLYWLGVLTLGAALWRYLRTPYRRRAPRRLPDVPWLAIAVAIVVLFEVLSFVTAAVRRYPAYTIAKSNIAAFAGQHCGLAHDVLVEPDPNAGMLTPLNGTLATALAGANTGFAPNAVAAELPADDPGAGMSQLDSGARGPRVPTATARAQLPFGLDPATPVLGNYRTGSMPARLATGWFRLPASRGPLLAFTAAGRIAGDDVRAEFAAGEAAPHVIASTPLLDIGPAPSWRNLRVPLDAVPNEASLMRITAALSAPTELQWLALTPPRVPVLRTLDEYVGRQAPVLLDWVVGLQFPCQRPFGHRDGVAQLPEFRILPDRGMAGMPTDWEGHRNGGPLGWINLLTQAQPVASYLNHDWSREWGELQRLTPNSPGAKPAALTVTPRTRTGWWTPGHLNTSY